MAAAEVAVAVDDGTMISFDDDNDDKDDGVVVVVRLIVELFVVPFVPPVATITSGTDVVRFVFAIR